MSCRRKAKVLLSLIFILTSIAASVAAPNAAASNPTSNQPLKPTDATLQTVGGCLSGWLLSTACDACACGECAVGIADCNVYCCEGALSCEACAWGFRCLVCLGIFNPGTKKQSLPSNPQALTDDDPAEEEADDDREDLGTLRCCCCRLNLKGKPRVRLPLLPNGKATPGSGDGETMSRE